MAGAAFAAYGSTLPWRGFLLWFLRLAFLGLPLCLLSRLPLLRTFGKLPYLVQIDRLARAAFAADGGSRLGLLSGSENKEH
ncbi:hypothetical protein AVL48_20940 [Amycolatopsis regifaucium]|uniref:Uncharacterized protein n=1 Tax=Amycolatopsis regifaucium TaxID=546365 RepID=A0A154MS37_9PSEU|nr:hypothetical protein AVL48_20940 [Amycolatopsis regifaucium]OKA07975.1 hypothetical protein ATP06_0211705 [Amycolatopsis regifaucium]